MSDTTRRLTTALLVVMSVQAAGGLLFQSAYRDVDWVRAAWFGNDWVTLLVAVPLLWLGAIGAARGSIRGCLLWLGLIGYAVYNYAFYVFGAALNVFFLMYILALVLAVVLMILALSRLDVSGVADSVRAAAPLRLIGGSLTFVGSGLASVWIATWAAYVFAGRPTPVEPEVFKLVAALDLSLMVPVLTLGGVLLWRREPWGYVVAAIASIQTALYLFVLSFNAIVLIRRGLADAPGELPIWGPLTILTTTVACVLWANVRPTARRGARVQEP